MTGLDPHYNEGLIDALDGKCTAEGIMAAMEYPRFYIQAYADGYAAGLWMLRRAEEANPGDIPPDILEEIERRR